MRFACVAVLLLLLCRLAASQTADTTRSGALPSVNSAPSTPQTQPSATRTPQQSGYANYSIMLVSPAGGAVVLMHNPKNELELIDVNNTNRAFSAGYAPVRAVEISELIASLKEEIARLTAENKSLQGEQARQASAPPPSLYSQAELEARRRAQVDAENAARRQQLIQGWLMLQNMNRPQTQNLNVNVTDCTRFPALCVAR